MEKSQATGTAVALVNWQVKDTPVQFMVGDQQFEMVATNHSKVEEAPDKEFEVTRRDSRKRQAEVKISEVEKLNVNQQVSVVVNHFFTCLRHYILWTHCMISVHMTLWLYILILFLILTNGTIIA